MTFPFITDNEAFAAFCRSAMQAGIVGIDTEFVWTNTFYPRFGLLQLAYDREHAILADPMAITETAAFRSLLESPDVLKVFHEAASDLPILHRWCGAVPAHVADTRIAAGFCGLTGRLSLAKLVQAQLGVRLSKTETLTDWTQRPLTDAQLAYAGNDVVYLPELWRSLESMLRSFGNLERFRDEMGLCCTPAYYEEIAPEDFWRHAEPPRYLHFTLQDYAVYRELIAWRERTAREKDIPRARVVKDVVLANMAVRHPYSAEELFGYVGIWPSAARRYGGEIAAIVRAAMKLPKEAWPLQTLPRRNPTEIKAFADRILSLATKRAEAHGIEPSFLCSRHDAGRLVTATMDRGDDVQSPLLRGWRRELLGGSLTEILADIRKCKTR